MVAADHYDMKEGKDTVADTVNFPRVLMGFGVLLILICAILGFEYEERVMILHNSEQTQQFGKEFANRVKNGGIICLYGDLGAGKTTFTQGLAHGLGIKHRIISPTFVIVRTYQIPHVIASAAKQSHNNKKRIATDSSNPRNNNITGSFYHIDLYRINSEQELIDLGLPEILSNPQNIVVIEWAEKLGFLLPKRRWDIRLDFVNDTREASVENIT